MVFFVKHGDLKFEVFTLNSKENITDLVNLIKTISAREDEGAGLEYNLTEMLNTCKNL